MMCVNYLFNGQCVEECPITAYEDESGECKVCNRLCSGCTGPNPTDCVK